LVFILSVDSLKRKGPLSSAFRTALPIALVAILKASKDNRANLGTPSAPGQFGLDTRPKSRDETLASLMRRFRICEERGSGIDKVVFEMEFHQLPAPMFEAPLGFTRIMLFSHRSLAEMDKADRARACYLHACLKRVQHDYLTNASVRERFGID
jgi:ATP-dependent DNA helicase RecG